MSTDTIPLGFADLTIPNGSHVGFPYRDEDERFANLLDFTIAGLANGEKCVVAVPEYTAERVLDGLRSRGTDPRSSSGRVEVLTAGRLFRGCVSESIQGAIDVFGGELESSLAEGWPAVRAYMGFSYLYGHGPAVRDLLAAESETNDCVRDTCATILCSFSREELHPRLMEACLQCHPFLTNGASFTVNDCYMNPAEFRERLPEMLSRFGKQGVFVPQFASLDFHTGLPMIRACPELDFYTCGRLADLSERMIGLGHRRLIVDLSATTYIDASSIHVLLDIARRLEGMGGFLSIYDPLDPPRKVFRIARVEDQMPIYRRLDEAASPAYA